MEKVLFLSEYTSKNDPTQFRHGFQIFSQVAPPGASRIRQMQRQATSLQLILRGRLSKRSATCLSISWILLGDDGNLEVMIFLELRFEY